MKRLRTLVAVAWYEWKLQLRSWSFWVIGLFVAAFLVLRLRPYTPEVAFLPTHLATFGEELSSLLPLLLLFLIPAALDRDRVDRTLDLLWTTPATVEVYIGGKILGVLLSVWTLVTAEIALHFLVRLPYITSLQALANYGRITFPIVFPTVTYLTCLYIFLTTIFPRPLYFYPLVIAYWFVTLTRFGLPTDVLNFQLFNLFTSDMVGFGPDWPLVLANRAVYILAGLCLAALALLVYQRRERRSLTDPLQRRAVQGLTVGALLGLIFSLVVFSQAARAATGSEGGSAVFGSIKSTSALQVRQMDVEARVYPDEGRLQGTVTFDIVRLTADTPLEINFEMSPGLWVQALRLHGDDRQLEWRQLSDRVWRARLPEEIKQQGNFSLRVEYAGHFKLPRLAYQTSGLTSSSYLLREDSLGYIGQGIVFLTPAAHWYPVIQNLADADPTAECRLTITLPPGFTVLTEGAQQSVTATGTTLRWTARQGCPRVTLAAARYTRSTGSSGVSIYTIPEHRQASLETTVMVITLTDELNRLIRGESQALAIAAIPLARYMVYGESLLLLPENLLSSALSPYGGERSRAASPSSDLSTFRWLADEVIRQWWRAQMDFAELPPPDYTPAPGALPPPQYNLLLEGLTGYYTMLLADKHFGEGLLSKELALRTELLEKTFPTPESILLYRQERIRPLGLERFPLHTPVNRVVVALAQLRERMGEDQFNRLISTFWERYRDRAVGMSEFRSVLEAVGGNSLATWFASQIETPRR